MKKSKKICNYKIVTLMIAMLSLFSVTALAASSYTTSFEIDFRSTVTGSNRTFSGRTHVMSNKLHSRDNYVTNNYCMFTLQKKSGLSYISQGIKEQNLLTVGSFYSSSWTSMQDGTYRYFISNRYTANDPKYTQVEHFKCDQVTLSSN